MSQGDWIETYTGKKFFVMDPSPLDVNVDDIAHSLSMLCRYFGHVQRFFSVAEHSTVLAWRVLAEINDVGSKHHLRKLQDRGRMFMTALYHDATEAYTGDMARPLKINMPEFKAVEKRIGAEIASALDLFWPIPDLIKEFDTRILADERDQAMSRSGNQWQSDSLVPLGVEFQFHRPEVAELEFRKAHEMAIGMRYGEGGLAVA